MIPMIQQAVSMGYTSLQILNYISKMFKKSAPGIQSAKQQGYSDEDILKFLSGKIKPKNQKNLDNQLSDQEKYLKSVGIKTKEEKKESRDKFLSGALGLGASALGAYKMYDNYGGMLKGLGQTFGQGGTATQPPITPQAQAQPQANPIQPGPQIAQQIAQQAQQPMQQLFQSPTPTPVTVSQESPQQEPTQQDMMAADLEKPSDLPSLSNEFEEETEQKNIFDQLISGVDTNALSQEKQNELRFLGMISNQLQSKGKTLKDPEFKKIEKKIKETVKGKPGLVLKESARFEEKYPEKPMEQGRSIITPSGDIGTIEDSPGKTAKVNIDGKKQVYSSDDLVPVPDNHEEIGTLYQQLIEKIPEGNKSRVYDAIGYDPIRKALKYTYHDGKTYIIDDVPEEIAKEIADSQFLAKTSGGNFMGLYYKGNPSIGAGMSMLISDLQKLRGGKGKEYSYKFEELYSQHRLPKQILKEKFEKEKLNAKEEKAKKKRSSS